MSISTELTLLANSKQAIKNSINQKGGSITDSTPFADYSTAIDNLPSGGDNSTLIDLIERDITTLNIPSGTTKIGTNAMSTCSSLTSVTIPSSVTEIGLQAFSGCTHLQSVTIPSGVTSIGDYAFNACFGLSGTITIPSSVTRIGNGAFASCQFSELILNGGGVIGGTGGYDQGAFASNTHLNSVTIGSGVTVLGVNTFKDCTILTSVVIPDSVTTIRTYCFSGCNSIKNVSIGSGVTLIDQQCFVNCSSLETVAIHATTPPTLGANAFINTNQNLAIYVPAESVNDYKAATNWSSLASRIFAIEQVATVDGNPVYNYDLGMTGTVVGIPQMAKMPTGTTIEFAEGITSIQQVISGYTTVTLPSTLTGLENLQNIIGSSVTTLIIKADTPPTAQANTPGGAGLTALYVPEASVTDYQADAAWGQFSAITYPLYEVATVDGKSVYNADLGETGQVTTMTSAMLAALPTGTSVKFSDDIDTFSGQIGAYEQVTLPASGATQLEFTVASPINAATETLVVPFSAISGPDIVVANDTLGGAGLTEIIIESDVCGMNYNAALEGLMNTAGFTSFADIIKAKPEDFMVITNLDVEPNPDGVFTLSLAHGKQDTESADPNAMIYYAPFTICKPSFATDQATSDGTYLNQRGRQQTYTPQVTGLKLYNGDTLVTSDAFFEVDNTGIGADWNSANNVWSIIFYTEQIGDGSGTITLQPGMRFEGFIDGINYDYDSETSCQPMAHSYFTINVTA